MKYAVSVLNIGNFMDETCRASLEHAAERWGADFYEITTDKVKSPSGCQWFNKFVQLDRYEWYDGVLQIDADVMVSIEAPSPFDEWESDKLGVVNEFQPDAGLVGPTAVFMAKGYYNAVVRRWQRQMKMPPPPYETYINGGFMIYNPAAAEPWFEEIMRWGAKCKYGYNGLSDQTILSILAYNEKIPVQRMGTTWNVVHAGMRPKLMGPGMCYNVYHFCGTPTERPRRYSQVDWRLRQ